ncbi:hypothetical protein MKW92_032231 [Papaver armeniacum]|nr:hypothetical protein MKW92_032231 [Papaver armeniacum]
MASSSSIPVKNLDESIGTTTPATIKSIAISIVTATPSQIEVSMPLKASGKKQSDCWQHFTKRLDLMPPKVECKHCKTKFMG